EDAVPVADGELVDRDRDIDGGIVDEDVDTAESRHRRFDGAIHGTFIGNVRDDGYRLPGLPPDGRGDGFRARRVTVQCRDAHAVHRQPPGDGGAESAARTGDQDHAFVPTPDAVLRS